MGSPRSVGDVAQEIIVTTHNSGNSVLVSKNDLKSIGNRSRITEGFVAPLIMAIESCGFTVERKGSASFSVSSPPDGPIPFKSAKAESVEAQNTGMRHVCGGSSSDVLGEDGNFL
jgi:hypothetical protein